MRKYCLVLPVLSLLLCYSCIKEHPDPDSPECKEEQMVVIKFDWTLVGEPDEELIDVLITDEVTDEAMEIYIPQNGKEVELNASIFEFVGNEEHNNVTLERCTVTVKKDAGGNWMEPVYFAAGSTEQQILEDVAYQEVVIPMRRQTRDLIIRVILNGEGLNFLDHLAGEISGVAMSRLMNDGFPPMDGLDIHPAFATGSVTYNLAYTDDTTYSDRHTLLGTDSNSSQLLDLTVFFTDGYSRDFRIDVTERMVGFHTLEVREPWILELVLNIGVGGSGMEVTIEEWYGGTESNLVVH